jgi:hypothetical protein
MPILIPTAGEIQRMTNRERAVHAKRIPEIRRILTESLATLALDGLDPFPSRREVRKANQRTTGSAEADQARIILATMPPDPDVAEHVVALCEAIA